MAGFEKRVDHPPMKNVTFRWPWIASSKRSQTSPKILHEKSSDTYPKDAKDAGLWWIFGDLRGVAGIIRW
jgi:hypothetical protein